ncbi:MAG: hypothetical protein KDD62_04680 [Bdellovibrionales bacterium]|nr:hypothetical protein [Bdellovibrionales bacterium]
MDNSRSIPAVMVLMLIAALYFVPAWAAGPENIPGSFSDSYSFVWNFWWAQSHQEFGDSIRFTTAVFYPSGSNLALHSFVPFLTLPMSLLPLEPARLMLLACSLCFCLNSVAFYVLAIRIQPSRTLACLFSLVLSFHPFLIGHLWAGHLNFLVMFPLVWLISEALSLFDPQAPKRFYVVATLATNVLAWSNLYYTYFALLIICLCLCFRRYELLRRPWQLALFLGVLVLTLGIRLFEVVALSASHLYSPNHKASSHSADILHYLINPKTSLLNWGSFQTHDFGLTIAESGLALGCPVMALALYSLWKRPSVRVREGFLLTLFLVFFTLSFGPQIHLGGEVLASNPVYWAFRHILPGFPTVPARFGIVAIICLYSALLIRLQDRGLLIFTFALSLLTFVPQALPLQVMKQSSALSQLQADQNVTSVGYCTPDLYEPIRYQMQHGKRIPAGFLARRPLKAEQAIRKNRFLQYLFTGRVKDVDKLVSELRRLKLDGVICPKIYKTETLRLASMKFLSLAYEDEQISVYLAQTS